MDRSTVATVPILSLFLAILSGCSSSDGLAPPADQDAAPQNADTGDAGTPPPGDGATSEGGASPDGFSSLDSAAPSDAKSGGDAGSAPARQIVIGHRGAAGHAPEHTFASYDLALTMGADYIEQDVAMTADGVLVCLHDGTLDRTARGTAADCQGSVSTKTLAQLKTCDMGSWFNEANPTLAKPEYVGLTIPTLEEVFQRYGKNVNYYIETKILSGAAQMEPELLRLIIQYGLREGAVTRRSVLVQSFSADSLQRMHALDADIKLVLLGAYTNTQIADAATYAFGIGPTYASVNAGVVGAAHAAGLAIHPYTVDSPADLERIARLCVDGMFTNYPDRYRAVLDRGGIECPGVSLRPAFVAR